MRLFLPTLALAALAAAILLAPMVLEPVGGTSAAPGATPAAARAAGGPVLSLEDDGPILVSEAGRRTSEFMLAERPGSLGRAASYIDWDSPQSATGCGLTLSDDGGLSWRAAPITSFLDLEFQRDPWVSLDEDGSIHAVCMAREKRDNSPTRMWYTRSEDDGATWTPRVIVPHVNPQAGVDKISILADSQGRVHVCFMEGGSGVVHALSRDGGVTWAPTKSIWRPGHNCNGIVEGSDGMLYVLVSAFGRPLDVRVLASADGGDTWSVSGAAMGMGVCSICTPVASSYNPAYSDWALPSLGLSPTTGAVFVALQSLDEKADGLESQRYAAQLWRSADRGATFQQVALPPLPPSCEFCHEMRPSVVVDPSGMLAMSIPVEDDAGLQPREIWLVVSADDGSTWSAPLLVSVEPEGLNKADATQYAPMPDRLAWAANELATNPTQPRSWADAVNIMAQWPVKQKDGGHYWDISWNDDGFLVAWIDYREGPPQIWARVVHAAVAP